MRFTTLVRSFSPGIGRRSLRPRRLTFLAAAVAIGLAVTLPVDAAGATLTAPSQAAPGAQISVAGSGFAAGQTGSLTYNGGALGSFAASGSGAFNVSVTIPSSAAYGTGRISAKTSSGTLLATTTLTIAGSGATPTPPGTPGPTPPAGGTAIGAPAQACMGDVITVSGSGFASGQAGSLTYNGGAVGSFTANSGGSFDASFAIPSWATIGTGRISAKSGSGSLLATTTIAIVPELPSPTPSGTPAATPTPTVAPTPTPTAVPTPTPTATGPSGVPNFKHVYVIIFENKEYSSIVGSSAAPYINSLIKQYGLATNFDAETHPSQGNYIALTSGGLQGVTGDGTYNLGATNLFDQLEAAGKTWHVYAQGNPGNCFTGSSSSAVTDRWGKSGSYVRKHNPAISYTDISGNPSRCAKISNFASFDPAAADFELIVPNMINDMHDGTVADGDNFLKAFLPTITGSSAFANSVVYLTFDEGTTNIGGGGHIFTMALSPGMTPGYQATALYTHYSMLRTIEDAWRLPCLGKAATSTAMAFPY